MIYQKKQSFKLNTKLLLFALMIFVTEDYLCLFDMERRLYSLNTIILIIWGIFQFPTVKNICNKTYRYNRLIMLYMISLMISICSATFINGEPIYYAIFAARQAFVILLYFPIKLLVNTYGRDRITNIVLKIGTFIALALIIQSLLYPKITIINTVSNARLGRYRTYYFMAIIIFNIMFYFSKVFTKKMERKDIVNLSICLIAFIFVQQTKSAIIAVVCACLFVFLFDITKGKFGYKIIIILGVILLMFLGRDYFLILYMEASDALSEAISTSTGNFGIRIRAINFIMNSLKGNELFGLGYYYGKWNNSDYITGWAYGYAMGDVGFFQQLFHNGFIGLIISFLILVKLSISIWKMNKKDNYSYFGKLIVIYMAFISMFNYYFTSDNMIVYLCIYMAIFDKTTWVGGYKNGIGKN